MADYTLEAETGKIKLSPDLFRHSACDYFQCYLCFPPGKFSAVPFFLCCRAIELALKAQHLESKSQAEVKDLYRHDLEESYQDLDASQRILTPEEEKLLIEANKIYVTKEFEYLNVLDAGRAYDRFPDLDMLGALARKLTA